MMKTFVYTKRFVYTMYVYAEQSGLFLTTTQIVPIPESYFEDTNWLPSLNDRKDGEPYRIARPTKTDNGYTISVIKPIVDQGGARRLGAVVVNIEIGKIREFVALGEAEGDFSIMTPQGEYLYPQPPPGAAAEARAERTDGMDGLGGGATSEVRKVSSATDLRYEQRLSLSRFSARLKTMRDLSTALSLLSLATALVASVLVAWSNYRPIRRLLDVLEDPDPDLLSDKRQDEVRYIAAGLVRTIQSNRTLREEMQTQLSLLDRTRTAALQAQINPHFLYNTLDSIRWSALELTGGDNKVSAMIYDLARLLRLSMEIEEHAIPVRQEMEHACMFLRLLKVRYPDKFEVQWDLDDAVLDRLILKLCLQPIIENAYTHGIKPTRRKGKIDISGKEEQGRLVFRIRDNGRGIEAGRLRELRASFLDDGAASSDHIGLANVNARIKLVFGPGCGLEIESEAGKGTLVILRMP
jgi:two-component system sensor histidine kinase YesM